MNIFVDGSGFSPKTKTSRAYILSEDKKIIVDIVKNEEKTNNEMEYWALIGALKHASEGDTIYTDSKLLVGQCTQNWKCNFDHLKVLKDLCIPTIKEKKIKLVWIPREENLAGKFLEKELGHI